MKENKPTLSLCMIVKNEEKFLHMCLESVKDYVDEIILVDTGSTDSTVEIAMKHNAKIYHHPWENSFSKARNYSLKYATCDWILILDADEEIDRSDSHKLREVIKDEASQTVNLIFLPVLDKVVGGRNKSICNAERMFRNNLGFQYEGIVHNSLKYSGPTRNYNIKIYHYGYTQGEEQMEMKFVRTTTLLKEQIKAGPENPVPHHYLAVSYLDRNKNNECIKEALDAIRLFELQDFNVQKRLLSLYVASVAFYRIEDLNNAEVYVLKALDLYPDYLDANCLLTSICFRNEEYDKCIEASRRYLSLLESIKLNPSTALFIPYNTIQHAWLVYIRIAIIYYIRNDEEYGINTLKSAIDCADNKWEPYFSIGKYFYEKKDFGMAERFLREGLKVSPMNENILRYLAMSYKEAGFLGKAKGCFENILEEHPDNILAQYNLGLICLDRGRFDEAINLFKAVVNNDPNHIEALFNQAITYERMGENKLAECVYKKLLAMKPDFAEGHVRLGSLYLNDENYTEAKKCFLDTLKLGKYYLEAHLGLSKIYVSLDDWESCVMICDELLRQLNLPRNITINSISDLGNMYSTIGARLMSGKNEVMARFSFDIAGILNPNSVNNVSV